MKSGLITRDTDYAVRALCAMAAARPGQLFTVTGLSGLTGVPLPFLRGILQKLSREGILLSARGRGGGFRLERDPAKISVLDLMALFQGDFRLANCLLNKDDCPNSGTCRLRRKLDQIEKSVFDEMGRLTIGGLVKG